MKLAIALQYLLLLFVGLPILGIIVAIATIDQAIKWLVNRVPDITITWRSK